MGLRFIYGRAGCGKSYFCLNDIRGRLSEEGRSPLILMVPEQFSLQAERNLIKILGTGGIMQVEVLSFRRMAYRVFNEVGGITRQHVNSASKCMLIYRIIDKIRPRLKIFSKAINQRGFVNTLSDTITELKRHNITPGMLAESCEAVKDNRLLRDKLSEIALLYSEFTESLQARYMDSDDDLTELAKKLDVSRQFDGAEIWMDEFSGFTPQEYLVIEKLMKKASRLNVCLCTDYLAEGYDRGGESAGDDAGAGTGVFIPAGNTLKKLLKLARNNDIAVESPVVTGKGPAYRFKDSDELVHLESQFFSFPYSTYPHKTRDLSIFSAVSIYTEVESTARDIIKLCRDGGVRYRDMAVVCRDLDAYEGLITAIFSEYGIPFFMDRKRDITGHPLVVLILSALEIFKTNWSYESVFRYLKTGLTGIKTGDMDVLENYVLACGIRGNRWTRDEDWNFRVNAVFEEGRIPEYELEVIKKVNTVRWEIVKPLLEFRQKTRGRRQAREICSALFDLLCSLDIPERIEKRVDAFNESGEFDLASEYRQVWNIVMEVLTRMVEVMGDEGIGLEKFSDVLATGFGEYKIGVIPPALDQVLVGSVERSKSQEISALYILGVNDGVFPAAMSEESILSDKDRETLRSAGLELAQDARNRAFEEQYLVYTALTTAGKRLRLSYAIADHEGRTLRPSMIITRVRKIFPKLSEFSNIVTGDTDTDNLELVAVPAPTFNQLVAAVRRQAEGNQTNPLWQDVYRWYAGHETWGEKCSTAFSGFFHTNSADPVSSDKVKKLYGNPAYSSISRIESFASCPFSYYMKYSLGAKERKIFKLNPPDIGTFMHTVIDRFSSQLAEKDMSWRTFTKEWCYEEVSAIVDGLLGNAPGWVLNSSERYKYMAGRLKRIITRALCLISEHIKRSAFESVGYEMTFGDAGNFKPITIVLPTGEEIRLTGRIDRVDAMKTGDGTYLRIVDYKSGSKAFRLSDVYYGLQVQLITYLDALWENGHEMLPQPILPGGILYFKIDDPIIKCGSQATEEEIEKAIMKQLKMKGLLLADVKVIKTMDNAIDGDSDIIPARLNKGDVLGRSSAATLDQFELLRKHVRKLLVRIGEEILKGDVSIKPYKKNNMTSCSYCSYSSVCQFDPAVKDNRYRILSDMKDDEVWKIINE